MVTSSSPPVHLSAAALHTPARRGLRPRNILGISTSAASLTSLGRKGASPHQSYVSAYRLKPWAVLFSHFVAAAGPIAPTLLPGAPAAVDCQDCTGSKLCCIGR